MSNICAGIGRGQMTVLDQHLKHHKHVQALYEELLKDVKGVTVRSQPHPALDAVPHQIAGQARDEGVQGRDEGVQARNEEAPVYDSNYWLCTITIDPEVKIKGQENAYKTIVKGAVGGAAGVIHVADSATTDCQPNDNVMSSISLITSKMRSLAKAFWQFCRYLFWPRWGGKKHDI